MCCRPYTHCCSTLRRRWNNGAADDCLHYAYSIDREHYISDVAGLFHAHLYAAANLNANQLTDNNVFRVLPISGYDSGDCCSCTCVSSAEFTCGDSAHGGYSCIDPSAQCVDDDDVTVNPDSEDTMYYGSVTPNECIPDYLADGLCDLINNDEVCGASRSLTNYEWNTCLCLVSSRREPYNVLAVFRTD